MDPGCGRCLGSDCRGFPGYTDPDCPVHGRKPVSDEKPKIDYVKDLIDRVDSEGIATARVEDGRIFVFTAGVLRRLLADAEAHPKGKAIVYVREKPKEVA